MFRPPFQARENEAETKAGKYIVDSNGVFFCEADSVKHAKELIKHLNGSSTDSRFLTEVFNLLTLVHKEHLSSHKTRRGVLNKVDSMRSKIGVMVRGRDND